MDDLRDVLHDQNGCLTRAQAKACGLSPAAIARRLASGDWETTLPDVLRATDREDTPLDRVRRAGLWAGDEGTVIGTAAAAWWHLRPEVPDLVGVVRPLGASGRAPAGIALHRGAIPAEDRIRVGGIMVTTRPRTVLDAAVELGLVNGARVMDRALQQGAVGLESLRGALNRRVGVRGQPRAVELFALATGGARSEAERRTVRALHRGGLNGFALNHPVTLPAGRSAFLDIAFVAERLAIEVDGWAFHRDVDRFRDDARRQNAVVLAGWRVLRVTWYDVRDDPEAVVDSVRRALAAA